MTIKAVSEAVRYAEAVEQNGLRCTYQKPLPARRRTLMYAISRLSAKASTTTLSACSKKLIFELLNRDDNLGLFSVPS